MYNVAHNPVLLECQLLACNVYDVRPSFAFLSGVTARDMEH